jgi:hypothetical protein
MALKIMVAGCSKDERALIESGVRAGLGERGNLEAWTVSVVKFGSGWSVTLDGPFERTRGLSFMVSGPAGPEELAKALRSAADSGGVKSAVVAPVSTPVAGAPASAGAEAGGNGGIESGRGPHKCVVCGRQYVVIYDADPGEPLEPAPVACPHCWQIGMVQVARSVSVGQDYRAEKV